MLCKPSLFHSLEMTCRQRLLDQALPGHEAVPQRLLLSRGLLQEVPRWQVLQRPKVASPDLLPIGYYISSLDWKCHPCPHGYFCPEGSADPRSALDIIAEYYGVDLLLDMSRRLLLRLRR